jgi:hypothetical protein
LCAMWRFAGRIGAAERHGGWCRRGLSATRWVVPAGLSDTVGGVGGVERHGGW